MEMRSGQRNKMTLNFDSLYNENFDEYDRRDKNAYHHRYLSRTQRRIAKAGKALIDAHKGLEASGSRRIATSGVQQADLTLVRDPSVVIHSDEDDNT